MQKCKYPLEVCPDRRAMHGFWMCEKDYCVLKDKPLMKTNADWIRSMSNEELAKWLTMIADIAQIDADIKCDYQWEEWLQLEKETN